MRHDHVTERHWCRAQRSLANWGRNFIRAVRPPSCVLSSGPDKKNAGGACVIQSSRLFACRLSRLSIGVLAPLSAHAQDDVRKRGDRACGGDSRRMCSKFFQGGDMAILGCLQQNKARLSGACRKFLIGVGQLQ